MDITVINNRLERIEKLLISQKDILNFNEAADFIGLTKSYLYKLSSTGMIPHYKPRGKQIYFDRKEIELWLLRNKVSSQDEIDEKADSYILAKQ